MVIHQASQVLSEPYLNIAFGHNPTFKAQVFFTQFRLPHKQLGINNPCSWINYHVFKEEHQVSLIHSFGQHLVSKPKQHLHN